jgi:hypothetical protein
MASGEWRSSGTLKVAVDDMLTLMKTSYYLTTTRCTNTMNEREKQKSCKDYRLVGMKGQSIEREMGKRCEREKQAFVKRTSRWSGVSHGVSKETWGGVRGREPVVSSGVSGGADCYLRSHLLGPKCFTHLESVGRRGNGDRVFFASGGEERGSRGEMDGREAVGVTKECMRGGVR